MTDQAMHDTGAADTGAAPSRRHRRFGGHLARLGVAAGTVLGAASLSIAAGGVTTPSGASTPSATLQSLGPTIFVGNDGANTLTGYPLTSTGNVAPTSVSHLPSTTFATLVALAFGPNGNLWVASTKTSISAYSPTDLATGGTITTAVTITGATTSIDGADDAAFDTTGNLWVSNWSRHSISGFAAATVTATGTVAPMAMITTVTTDFTGLQKIAFDNTGNLWASNEGGFVMEFTAAQLQTGGAVAPAVTLSGSAITNPIGLAFDAGGNLWISNPDTNSLEQIAAATLAASGTPTPAVTITTATATATTGSPLLSRPWQITFDSSGDLWVPNFSDAVLGYTPAQLASGGAITPQYLIKGTQTTLTGPSSVAVSQAPTITSITPSSGPAGGGTVVTVQGSGFTSATTVDFGSHASPTVTVTSPYTLTAVAPPGTGTVDVTASTFAGTSATSTADLYTYGTAGYTMVGSDGGVFAFGGAPFEGSLPGLGISVDDIKGIVPTADRQGYWMVGADGGVFAFGDAGYLGSLPGMGVTVSDIKAFVPTPSGNGYWMVGADGGVFAFGDAGYLGSLPALGVHVGDIVGMVPTADGNGYWMVGADGGVFAFGDATYTGSLPAMGVSVSNIVGIVGTADAGGYWMVGTDGGVFAFGDAGYVGSLPGLGVTVSDVTGIIGTPTDMGYTMVGTDGGVFCFGDAAFAGSLPGLGVTVSNVVGIANG